MDVFSALQTAVSGMKAQGFSLENISGNIANSQTTGFKRVDTSFVDLVAEQAPRSSGLRQRQGEFRSDQLDSGQHYRHRDPDQHRLERAGFLRRADEDQRSVNGQTSFSAGNLYTRRGDFHER